MKIYGNGDQARVFKSTVFDYEYDSSIVAIGDGHIRKKVVETEAPNDTEWFNGTGTWVAPRTYISEVNTHIGAHCLINTGAIIEHDCSLGDYCTINPGAILCGRVTLGEGVTVGAGAVIRDGVSIAPWTVIGMGAIVVKDITEEGTCIGCPARRMEDNSINVVVSSEHNPYKGSYEHGTVKEHSETTANKFAAKMVEDTKRK